MTFTRVSFRPLDVRVLGVSLVAFALVTADVVSGGPLTHLDGQIRAGVQPRLPPNAAWMGIAGSLGDIGVAAAMMAIAGLVAAQIRWRFWPLLLAAGNLVAVEIMVYGVKAAVGRPGPGVEADRTGYPGYFPSGHTATAAVATATVVFLVLASRWGAARLDRASTVALVAGLLVGVVAAVRSVLGDFHWASDVLGGLAAAAIVLTLGFATARAQAGSAVATPTSRGERRRPP